MEVQTKKERDQSIVDDFFAFGLKVVGLLTRHIRRELSTTSFTVSPIGSTDFFWRGRGASRTGRSAWRESKILENAET